MATLTDPEVLAPPEVLARPTTRRVPASRFLAAFGFGLLAVLAIAAGAILAFEASYEGRILPGVHVGSVDISGLSPQDARGRLISSFAALGDGKLTLTAAGSSKVVTYASLGRRLDTDGMIDQAMAAGRTGTPAERVAQHVRYAVSGYTIEPVTTLDPAAVEKAVADLARTVDMPATDAAAVSSKDGFSVTDDVVGRGVDRPATAAAVDAALRDLHAPSEVTVAAPVADIQPTIARAAADAARVAAEKIAQDVVLVDGKEKWTIPATELRGWITFGSAADGTYGPVVSPVALQSALTAIAAKYDRKPVDATFILSKTDVVIGVNEAVNGRALDVPTTLADVQQALAARVSGAPATPLTVHSTITEPDLTTAEAEQTAPLMKPVSQWTTYFPWGINNGFGANIWIPARDLDGMVVMPGKLFDFWRSIGPVTRARGYRDGGAIINGKTEPQGALAGGICSCSTTLFNAALRAGLQIGAKKNHYYYIDRYPLGLDATVFQSSSGAVQTMSWKNDTKYPIVIRSKGWRVGVRGYVRFTLWTVPLGRTVTLSKPIVKNVKHAVDTVVYTTSLAPGVRKRVEALHDGMDVWVTRTVTDATGRVIHKETFYSHYSRVNGVVQVGIAKTTTPTPTPTPTAPPGG